METETKIGIKIKILGAIILAALSILMSILAVLSYQPKNLAIVKVASVTSCQEGNFCGTIKNESGLPIPYAFLMFTNNYSYAISKIDGSYEISTIPQLNWQLLVQPPTQDYPLDSTKSIKIFQNFPRTYLFKNEIQGDVSLPAAGNLIIRAYDANGKIMNIGDFKSRGLVNGTQFIYGTDLNNETQEAVMWPAYYKEDADAGKQNWDNGLPNLVVTPGKNYIIQTLFWTVPGYGKLWLRADNLSNGFSVVGKGEAKVIDLNIELARTAYNDLVKRGFNSTMICDGLTINNVKVSLDGAVAKIDPIQKAMAADNTLRDALKLRDCLEFAKAKTDLLNNRRGNLKVVVKDSTGKAISGVTVNIKQKSHDMMPGVFQGPPYNDISSVAWQKARDAGFELATIIMPWKFTEGYDKTAKEVTFGITSLLNKGFKLKAHGLVWLYSGLIPENYLRSTWNEIQAGMLNNQNKQLVDFGDKIKIWESINEPATTNQLGTTFGNMLELVSQSVSNIKVASPSNLTLVNNPDEFDFGSKFNQYYFDNTPSTYFMTYSQLLKDTSFTSSDIIGLQYYPGYHLNAGFGSVEGPAMTPSFFYDMIVRYNKLNKPLHITEFSVPSTYPSDWKAGYWREPWTETTQADYAERIFTIAFANPNVKSVMWWDILDTNSAVVSGGMMRSTNEPKVVYTRLKNLFTSWTTANASANTNSLGQVTLSGFSGEYQITISKTGYKTQTVYSVIPNQKQTNNLNVIIRK